ncbi:hypothetical protein Ancab_000614 [Ancistrocladus abbreviatus]
MEWELSIARAVDEDVDVILSETIGGYDQNLWHLSGNQDDPKVKHAGDVRDEMEHKHEDKVEPSYLQVYKHKDGSYQDEQMSQEAPKNLHRNPTVVFEKFQELSFCCGSESEALTPFKHSTSSSGTAIEGEWEGREKGGEPKDLKFSCFKKNLSLGFSPSSVDKERWGSGLKDWIFFSFPFFGLACGGARCKDACLFGKE